MPVQDCVREGKHGKRLRKQPTAGLHPWDFSAEPGERVYQWQSNGQYAVMYDLKESRGRDKRAAGELTPYLVKKDGKPRLAQKLSDGLWYWVVEE